MKTFKNVLVLTLITVIAGFLLGYVYDITKEPIAEADAKKTQDALKKVFAEAASFDSDDESIHLSNSDAILDDGGFAGITIDNAYVAKDASGSAIGDVFVITTPEGYGGDITIMLGIKSDGAINGVEILSISETAGLGMKADTPEFKQQFVGKNVSKISYTKSGASSDYEIDALSGATITTNAVTNAVNAGLIYFSAVNAEMGGDVSEGN